MKNVIDYAENELARFSARPLNAVDSLVLSQLSYLRFENIVPGLTENAPPVRIGDLLKAELFPSLLHNVRDAQNNRRLLFALAASPRFRDIRLQYYVSRLDPAQEKQFSAVTCLLDGQKTAYIAYRGTDSTFVGWKEDFNMAFLSPIPAQEDGVRYLHAVAEKVPYAFLTGGHSKGGNLAVYAAMQCDPIVQDRITAVYSHDGPGFKEGVFESAAFLRIKDKIHKTLPQSSLIGMLLENQEQYAVVESSRYGIMQHDPFSWAVEDGDFLYAKKITGGAMYRNATLQQWLGGLTDEKRALFVDSLYQVLGAADAATVGELTEDWQKKAVAMLGAAKSIDAETKKFIAETVGALVKLSLKNLSPFKK